MMLKKYLATNIKNFRRENDLTQDELAHKLGVSVKYLQRLESKSPPNVTLNTLEKLSKALKIPAHLLITKP